MDNKLKAMFEAQKALVNRYIELSRMPKLPLILNSREGQKSMKEITGHFIEELSETYQEYFDMYIHLSLNDQQTAQEKIEMFKEEIADCWHFVLEILMYAGMDYNGLLSKVESYSPLQGWLSPETDTQVLNELFNYAKAKNDSEIVLPGKSSDYFLVSLFISKSKHTMIRVGTKQIEVFQQFLWNITHKVKQADNHLKNKSWKATNTEVDIQSYHGELFEMVLVFIQMLHFLSITPEDLYNIYIEKNEKNFDRIKNGY